MGKIKLFRLVVYFYILAPVVIFLLGWVRWYIAVPAACAILCSLFAWMKCDAKVWLPEWKGRKTIATVCLCGIIIVSWVLFSGIGGFVYQNTDHLYRNEIFNLLVEKEWPVTSLVETNGTLQTRYLSYYIGFWLPSAVVGKMFGLEAGYCFQVFWAVLGIAIAYYLICEWLGRFSVVPLVGMIFFSGLDIVGFYVLQDSFYNLYRWMHFEWWAKNFQFSSMTSQLFWVYNQAVYAWVLTMLILRQKDNRHIILIWSCGLLECTLPFVGMLPFVAYKIIQNRKPYKDLFTLENVLAGGCIGIISFLYLINNSSAGKSEMVLNLQNYGIFLVVEVGFFVFVIIFFQKRNILFWISLVVLLCCPLIRIGSGADFCMRASIPALLVLMILYFDTWQKNKGKKRILTIMFILLLIGSVTPIGEMSRTVKETLLMREEGIKVLREAKTEDVIMSRPNFSADTEDSFFYNFLAKKSL